MADRLTDSDVKKIKEEIEYRKTVVRKETIAAVKSAREYGDLSENFEYHAAKKDKNKNESRIRYLERMLKNATVNSEESKEDEVGLNKKITLYFEDDDCNEDYILVTSILGNSLENRISIESPMGKAILGHKIGDRIFIEISKGNGYYVVIKAIEVVDVDAPIRNY